MSCRVLGLRVLGFSIIDGDFSEGREMGCTVKVVMSAERETYVVGFKVFRVYDC